MRFLSHGRIVALSVQHDMADLVDTCIAYNPSKVFPKISHHLFPHSF